MSDQERIMSLEAEIRRLVVELGKANISWAKLAQAMEHTQQRAESAHARIDELSKDSSSQFKEQSKAILNLTVAQERLSGLIQKNVMTKEKFFGWLVIGATALAVLYSAIVKVLN